VSEWVCREANRSLTDFDELNRVAAAPSTIYVRKPGGPNDEPCRALDTRRVARIIPRQLAQVAELADALL
jgi:hypothetical protein